MRARLGAAALLTLVTIGPESAMAQAVGPAPLTLEALTSQAIAADPTLVALLAARAGAGAASIAAREARLPQVSFSDTWQRSNHPVAAFSTLLGARRFTSADFAVDRLNMPGTFAAFTGQLAVRQRLFDFGRGRAASSAARSRVSAADAAVQQALAGLDVAAARAFGRVLAAESASSARTAAIDAAREDVARAARRRDAGTATEADVLLLEVHLAGVEQERLEAEAEVAVARAALNRLRGATIDAAFSLEPSPAANVLPSDIAAATENALARRPEVLEAEARLRGAEAEAALARAERWPIVSAQAAYDVTGRTLTDRSGSWAAGGEVTWTASLLGSGRARAHAAADAVEAARRRLDDSRRAIEVEVLSAARRLDVARARLDVGARAVAQAAEALRILRNRYAAGLTGVSDLLRASAAALDAESRRVTAVVDVLVSTAEYRRAAGLTHGADR